MGPGYLVAVGYMDPGNWATALAGGIPPAIPLPLSAWFQTLWRLFYNLYAQIVGIATGRDLGTSLPWQLFKTRIFYSYGFGRTRHLRHRSGRSNGTALAFYLCSKSRWNGGVLITGLMSCWCWPCNALDPDGWSLHHNLAGLSFSDALLFKLAGTSWCDGRCGQDLSSTEIITNPAMLYIVLELSAQLSCPIIYIFIHPSYKTCAIDNDGSKSKNQPSALLHWSNPLPWC